MRTPADADAAEGFDSRTVASILDGPVADHPERVLEHVLLSTDGTVVPLLEGCFGEQIRLADHVQHLRPAAPTDPDALELSPDDRVLHRTVVLQGSSSGRAYVSAETLIVPDRLPGPVREDLLTTSRPIGPVLRAHRMETFREILEVGRTRSGRQTPDETRLFRTYRIVAGGRPVMLITETFPRFALPVGGEAAGR